MGATSIAADLNLDKAEAVSNEIRESGGKARAFFVDVASEVSVSTMVGEAPEQL